MSNGLPLKRCRAFRTEDGGDLKEKKVGNEGKFRNLKKSEVNLKKGNEFWNSVKTIVLRTFKGTSNSDDDEHRRAMAKVEEVLSSVSCLQLLLPLYSFSLTSTALVSFAFSFRSVS